ncbi:hypothetical protein I4U23_029198 [Adineta vaga]|nr:hypothetical protein I4U23_029198 [Adineta vaga]
MAANHKSTKQTTITFPKSNDFRLKFPSTKTPNTKPCATSPNRSNNSQIPKTSLIYPTLITRSPSSYYSNHQQYSQDTRYLYVVNASGNSHRTPSTQPHNINLNSVPLHQQSHILTSSSVSQPHPHYGHFLAYLRRQSLARLRRKQEQQELDGAESVDTTITSNTNKTSSHSLHSISNLSLGILTSDVTSMPAMSSTSKQKPRPITPHRQLQRSSSSLPTNYRLKLNQSLPLRQITSLDIEKEKTANTHSLLLPMKADSSTPANSLVSEANASSTNKTPYEVNLSGDMLSYCYVSDSGVTYQGQLLSSLV